MIRNYFKIALRSLLKEKVYSLINIVGLTMGVTCCLLIVFYVQDELSFDRFHENGQNIYRINGSYHQGGDKRNNSAGTTYQLAPELSTRIPVIKSAVRLQRYSGLVRYGDKKFMEERMIYADSNFFSLFTFHFLKGNPNTALLGTNTAVISEDMAKKYFGEKNPINEFINVEGVNVAITGVMHNIPDNSHLQADFVLSLQTIEEGYSEAILTNWGSISHFTYVELENNADVNSIEKQLGDFMSPKFHPERQPTFTLQPLYDVHLKSDVTGQMESGGDITYVYIFSLIALIIILIACVNFMNLSTARSVDRAKEVGLRKAVGAQKKQIILQFLSESVITTLIAFVFAGVLSELVLPYFNEISGKSISGAVLVQPLSIAVLLLLSIIIIGILAGIYPAFFLSAFQPSKVLKGSIVKIGKGNLNLRKILVVFQFCISITLIIGTIIINDQISFLRNQKLGMNPELLVKFSFQTREVRDQYSSLKNELLTHPSIKSVTASSNNLTNRIGSWRSYIVNNSEEQVLVPTLVVAQDFFKTLEVEFLSGRDFDVEKPADIMNSYIVNEAAAEFLGLENPVNTPVTGAIFTGSDWSTKEAKIIGVVKDFHFASLHSEIQPIMFSLNNEQTMGLSYLSMKIKADNRAETLSFIEETWSKFSPERPLDYSFVEDEVYNLYQAEDRFKSIFSAFSVLAIAIACLGIFGLAAFSTRKRLKEIGIRKVLGASISGITLLLSKDFAKLVLISNIIAWPLAWYMMNQWLKDFAYKIDITIWTFVLGMFITLFIAFLTVSSQAIKAALTNPASSLRNE